MKGFQYNRSYSWGGTEIKVWFGKVEGVPVYFLEPQNRYMSSSASFKVTNRHMCFHFYFYQVHYLLFSVLMVNMYFNFISGKFTVDYLANNTAMVLDPATCSLQEFLFPFLFADSFIQVAYMVVRMMQRDLVSFAMLL